MRLLAVGLISLALPAATLSAESSQDVVETAPTTAVCTTGFFYPHVGGYNPTHNAMVLIDPMNEQTATFDLAFGGTLVSLKYLGTELIYGDETGAQFQPNWFGGTNPEMTAENQFYNPQTGGDNNLGPPTNIRGNLVHGAYCTDQATLTIVSATADYSVGRGGTHNLIGVYTNSLPRGDPNPFSAGCQQNGPNCPLYISPFIVTTTATFVQNIVSPYIPHYYLKLSQSAAVADPLAGQFWSFQLAAYSAANTSNIYIFYPSNCAYPGSCAANSENVYLAGNYPSASYTGGVAVAISPATYWPGISTTYMYHLPCNSDSCQFSFYASGQWPLFRGPSTSWIWYVLAGDWGPAKAFACGVYTCTQ